MLKARFKYLRRSCQSENAAFIGEHFHKPMPVAYFLAAPRGCRMLSQAALFWRLTPAGLLRGMLDGVEQPGLAGSDWSTSTRACPLSSTGNSDGRGRGGPLQLGAFLTAPCPRLSIRTIEVYRNRADLTSWEHRGGLAALTLYTTLAG